MRPTAIKGERSVAYYDTLVLDEEQRRTGERVEDYYLSTDEQPGVWWGGAADELGLSGEGSREEFRALLDGQDPRTGASLGRRLRRDGVRGFDLTFSAPKSVSALSALCGGEVERAVIAAHDEAVRAVMAAVEERATTRSGTNGIYRIDVAGLAALLVRHRTSRTLDPQLHTHAVIAAKVKGIDGNWRALDATMVYRDQRALGSIYQAALRSELTARLGVAWTPAVKGQAEIAGMPADLLAAFSTRREQVLDWLRRSAEAFTKEHEREPSVREHAILVHIAARESRPAKVRGQQAERLRADWLQTAKAHGVNGQVLATAVLGASGEALAERSRGLNACFRAAELRCEELRLDDRLAAKAIEALTSGGSVWTIADVQRELAGLLDTSGGASARAHVRTVEGAAARIVSEHCVDLVPPRARGVALDTLSDPGGQRYTTRRLLEQEQRVVRLFIEAAAMGGRPVRLDAELASGLNPEQATAAGLVAGEGRLVVIVGPAGTGKTRAMRAAVKALEAQKRPVLGLAPWAVAAEQLGQETGTRAETVARLLTEHEGESGPTARLDLPVGTTLIVDEAGLLTTADTERLMSMAGRRQWRVALVGDGRQLAAVGRSGMFDHARTIAPVVQLREVQRFCSAWEGEASVALRECDPAALDAYERHGRVKSGSAAQVEAAVLEDWWQTTVVEGRQGAYTVSTNEQAQRLNHQARQRRVEAGEVEGQRVIVTYDGERIGAGDEIQTRRNDRRQTTDLGRWVRNRQRWIVEQVLEDGHLVVHGRGGRLTLDPDYSHEHVQLAYFSTVHSAQGLNREVGATLVDELAGWRSLYVGMTRGRERNTAYVVIEAEEDARSTLERALRRDRADLGVLGVQRRLSEEARMKTQGRVSELQAEQIRLRSANSAAARERLTQIRQELEQLQPRPPNFGARQSDRAETFHLSPRFSGGPGIDVGGPALTFAACAGPSGSERSSGTRCRC